MKSCLIRSGSTSCVRSDALTLHWMDAHLLFPPPLHKGGGEGGQLFHVAN